MLALFRDAGPLFVRFVADLVYKPCPMINDAVNAHTHALAFAEHTREHTRDVCI